MAIGASEAETFWTAFLRQRGLRGVELVSSDAHEGSRPPSRLRRLLAPSPSASGSIAR